jgi:hypothetical protein
MMMNFITFNTHDQTQQRPKIYHYYLGKASRLILRSQNYIYQRNFTIETILTKTISVEANLIKMLLMQKSCGWDLHAPCMLEPGRFALL